MPYLDTQTVASQIGASSFNPTLFIFFIPSRDKNSKELKDHDLWVNACIALCSSLFGGATVMAPAAGAWHNPETNEIIEESVTLIHSYASVDANNDGSKFLKIAEFLHRMGRETKQGEIGIVIDGVFHRITRFQKAAKS